jgi:hypothetical protein
VRFIWPAQRYDRLTREAVGVAAVVTAATGLAIGLPIVTIYRASQPVGLASEDEQGEVITFVRPVIRPRAMLASSTSSSKSASAEPMPIESSQSSDTGSIAAPKVNATTPSAEVATTAPAHKSKPTQKVIGPVGVPSGVRMAPVIGLPPPAWKWLPPTQEELDAAGRERDRLVAEAHDQHRPVSAPLGGASLPLPFLSSGPTREQRARDSVIHADNVLRLARLAERARAKRDSLLRANTLAGPAKVVIDPRRDSARLLRPNP